MTLELNGTTIVVGAAVLAGVYTLVRTLGARDRGEHAGRAAGRAAVESVTTLGSVALGLMLLLAAGGMLVFGRFMFMLLDVPVVNVFGVFWVMFGGIMYLGAAMLAAAAVACFLGGAGLVAGFWASRKGRRTVSPAPPPPPPPADTQAAAPPPPAAAQPHAPRSRRRERPLRAAGR